MSHNHPNHNGSYPRPPDELAELSPALRELDHYLLLDGAVWRRRLPDPGIAAGRALALLDRPAPARARPSHAPSDRSQQPPLASYGDGPLFYDGNTIPEVARGASARDASTHTNRSRPVSSDRHTGEPHGRRRPKRARGLAAVAAVVAVVGLLAIVLHAIAPGRVGVHPSGATPTATAGSPTPTSTPPVPGAWSPLPGYSGDAARDLALAPSDPQTAYDVLAVEPAGNNSATPTKFAPPPTYQLRQTRDGGATWRQRPLPVPQPAGGQASDYAVQRIAVSPNDPATVFLSIQLGTSSLCQRYAIGLGKSGGICLAQFLSQDGGLDWQPLHLPAVAPQEPGVSALGAPISAQGSRLYAPIGDFCPCSGAALLPRIGVSDDAGLTWRTADNALVAQGLGVDLFAATPSGATLFAVVEPVDASNAPLSASPPFPVGHLGLWRSDDAGASWSRVGYVPHNAADDLALAPTPGGSPTLYLVTSADATTAYTKLAAPALSVSTNGGASWSAIPSTGLPDGAADIQADPQARFPGVIGDGSILIYAAVPGSGPRGGNSTTVFAWKPGAAGWRPLTPPFTASSTPALLLAPTGAAAPQAYYLVSDTAVQRFFPAG